MKVALAHHLPFGDLDDIVAAVGPDDLEIVKIDAKAVPPKYSIVLMQLTFRSPRLSIIRHVRSVLVSYRSRYFGVQKSTRAHA